MGFLLFVLVNAALFIRPSEVIPDLAEVPIYNILISSCVLICLPGVRKELTGRRLFNTPITVCVLGLLVAVVLSHLSHYHLSYARNDGLEFLKIVVYYLLVVAVLKSPARLHRFLVYLAGMIGAVTVLSLLHYHGILSIAFMRVTERTETHSATGELYTVDQLYGTGIFADPNDLCLVLMIGIGLSLYGLGTRRSARSWLWAVPLVAFAYTLYLTKSRGGFLAMLACVLATSFSRFGWRKTIPIAALLLPALIVLFAGRQTDLSTSSGTGQQRIQLWAMSLAILRRMPLFGLGYGRIAEEIGHDSHNSFVHTFAELGYFGGTLFVGMYACAYWGLRRADRFRRQISDPRLRRMGPYLFGIAAGYAVGMFSLSRAYINPTYLIPGLVVAYLRLVAAATPVPVPLPRLDARLAGRLIATSAAALVMLYIYVRMFARFG
jgi:putative inorganic carbon (hco3(-)) transporter